MMAIADGVRWVGVLILCGWTALPSVADSLVENLDTQDQSDAQWIWSPAHTKNMVPVGDCFFRKSFKLSAPELGEIQITADNQFQLFVNGQPVGQGVDWRKLEVYDISKQLKKGLNTIAVQVTNIDEGSAGLVARVLVKQSGGTFESHSTNKSWKTSVRHYQNWTAPTFPESEWIAATSYGQLGTALPWGDEIVFAGEGARFSIPKDFTIERLMRDEEVGSLIAMAFDSRGNILASREGGPLLLLTDSDDNGTHDSVNVFCDKIINTQGILPLGSRVFVVGHGPDGVGLYRLRDGDRDGLAEDVTQLVPIRGSKGEHGAHAVRLGPDGLLYVIMGSHARVGVRPGPRSPFRNWYEGDLVQPRQEDPRGHAVGIPAPGGTIFRTDANGSFVELVAGGFRNPYDFAFSADGELFTYDADMEWDLGAPWYRPTRFNHVTAGAEFGWRSGWAKWPDYYVDSLPALVDIGKGSPTGLEFYNHTVYPEKYRGALFGCDWATGRIHCVRLKRSGATYRGEDEVFVSGRPLNATDISVGPDGAVYFCTGGRGTDGGVYRVRYTGEADTQAEPDQGIDLALRQPQLASDWARARVASVRVSLGEDWGKQLYHAAQDTKRTTADRLQALDLMMFFGPRPSDELLLELSQDTDDEMRAKAVRLMFNCTTQECKDRLVEALEDDNPRVRRLACETLTRSGIPTSAEIHARMLADDDRFVALAARRTLEQLPTNLWAHLVLKHPDARGFCQGAVSLLSCRRDRQTAEDVLTRIQSLLDSPGTTPGDQLTDLLRVTQLALIHGELTAEDVPELGDTLVAKYPSGDPQADRELVRLLVYLQVEGAAEKFASQLESDIPDEEKLHIGTYAAYLQRGWDTNSKLALMQYYESARALAEGYSVSAYVENFAREFFAKLSLTERRHILASGERWPASALSVLAKLPVNPDGQLLGELRALDQRVRPFCAGDDRFRRLRVGILAVLGRTTDEDSLDYLRGIYRDEPDWRDPAAMSLTQHPEGESWPYLVESLKTIQGSVAREVLAALAKVPQRPREPEPYRQVIMLGLRLGDDGADLALELLNHWSGQSATEQPGDYSEQLAQWQQWYSKNFPSAPPAELPVDSGRDKWSYEELLTYLESDGARNASPQRGEEAFTTAQCIKCHRCGTQGETLGPDLSTVAKRFQKKEILESIIYPSHVISDQYASRTVLSNGRSFTGLVAPRGDEGITVLLSDGEQKELAHEDIEQILPSSISSMPTGLLNSLTLEQVADLFAFLVQDHQADIAGREPSSKR